MSSMNWNKAKSTTSIKTNVVDEQVSCDRDGAARWLKANDPIKGKTRPKRRHAKPTVRREDRRHTVSAQTPGIAIYTDGACEPNPGKGGWGFVVYSAGREIHSDCGGDLRTTNNIMEMSGLRFALEWLANNPQEGPVTIFSDSQYVVKGCNEWRRGWKARGWQRYVDGTRRRLEPVKNADLWKTIDGLLGAAGPTIKWVKGHVGILGNERADELSNMGRAAAINAATVAPAIVDQLRYSV
jgi:ribonuclease HI